MADDALTTPPAVDVRPAGTEPSRLCEELVRDAFWNVYRPGCFEHLIWHRAAGHPDTVAALSLVAVEDGEPVGCVMSTRGFVELATGSRAPVLVLGPLAARPDRQGRGIGSLLVRATLDRARDLGECAVFLYGDPGYYPRFGFEDAGRYRVTTADGDNVDAFMGLELRPGDLDGISGRLVESALYEVTPEDVDAFDAGFPAREKEVRPGQL